ncbi:MAG: phosphoenolpyruvate synthase [Pseudomonadota bacterium]|nr:phosphoenolpyruvate synthase [Pseudomonadota bacterium]
MQENALVQYLIPLEKLNLNDIEIVGGKNASLGEMLTHLTKAGVNVPGGFATTAEAFHDFLERNQLNGRINKALNDLDVNNLDQLSLTGSSIRNWIYEAELQLDFKKAIKKAWSEIKKNESGDFSVAVRSSATAEDLPDASFAGQQETILNVATLDDLYDSIQKVFASLYTDRAISYRVHQGFDHSNLALSVGVQKMVRSDLATSGVMFTLDTESGFRDLIFITASWGLGECIVQGSVNPDEHYVYKPSLRSSKRSIIRSNLGSKAIKMVYSGGNETNETVKVISVEPEDSNRYCLSEADIESLAQYALAVEDHYQKPMDIEWAKDGIDGEIYLLQARPETVRSRESDQSLNRYKLKDRSDVLTEGRSIGQKIGAGKAKIINNANEMSRIQKGDVLVADMTDPDWEPVMKIASAIVTNRGGRTCHAAIIARELGIPAVVGCNDATNSISDGLNVTVSCAEGAEGYVYKGTLEFEQSRIEFDQLPEIPSKIMMNIANPDRAFAFSNIPNHGVGLARLEFIINRMIGIHPKALLDFDSLDNELKETIIEQMHGHKNPIEFFVDKLSEGIACIAAAFSPEPVIVRLSDFKSNEYANLIGGSKYEPKEENPMLGFRGASRYLAEDFQECFELEVTALKRVRDEIGLTNVQIMVPFVRTVKEAQEVIELLSNLGMQRGKNNLKIIMMCELPTNALLATDYLKYFDGMSIGSNDMTQLILGLDRDSGLIANLFDERDQAVKKILKMAIDACKKEGKYIGICGQGPSDHPDLAEWLVNQGIDSMSLNPDSVIETWIHLAGIKI